MGTQVPAGGGGKKEKGNKELVLEDNDDKYSSSVVQLYWKSWRGSQDTQMGLCAEELQVVSRATAEEFSKAE